jgi:hypothetical protein
LPIGLPIVDCRLNPQSAIWQSAIQQSAIKQSSLALLVFLIRADHPNHAAPADDLALIANALD